MKLWNWIIVLLGIFLMSSCVRYKDYVYIQAKEKKGDTLYYKESYNEYRLKKKDILLVHITSLNSQLKSIFDQQISSGGSSTKSEEGAANISGYPIDEDGNVSITLLGKFKAEGKTVKELEKEVQAQTNLKFNDATVILQLLSFRITFFGEIGTRTLIVNRDRINILEAIAMAGGINETGNKKQVLIMRPTETGTKTFRMDLTDRNLLSSKDYYLQPNDMVYVEPRRGRFLQSGTATYLSIISTVTTTFTIIFLFIKR